MQAARQPERYKLRDSEGAGFNIELMAKDFIFQHALEEQINLTAEVLRAVHAWYGQWAGAEAFKQTL